MNQGLRQTIILGLAEIRTRPEFRFRWNLGRYRFRSSTGRFGRYQTGTAIFSSFFLFFLHPKPLERSHASKAKSCPTTKGNCSSIANADQRRRVSYLPQWGEDFDSPHRPHSALLGLRVFHTTEWLLKALTRADYLSWQSLDALPLRTVGTKPVRRYPIT